MKALAAEVVHNFSSRLLALGISVRELTGDMQLTKYEIQNTQVWPRPPTTPILDVKLMLNVCFNIMQINVQMLKFYMCRDTVNVYSLSLSLDDSDYPREVGCGN